MVIDDKATAINALIEAVEAIETTLGLTPFGVYSDVRVRLDILEARINNPNAPAPNVTNPFYIDGYGGVSISVGDGYPTENRLPGSLYLRRDGYTYEGLYSNRDGYWQLIPTDTWTAGQDLSGNYYAQTVIGIQGRSVSDAAPPDGYILTWNNSLNMWEPQEGFVASGDLSGHTVVGIQGNPVSSEAPTDGYVLEWNATESQWKPLALPIVFDPLYSSQNIRSNRPVYQSLIDNTKVGIVNLASIESAGPIGVGGNYSSSLGGLDNIITSDFSSIVGGYGGSITDGYSSILGGFNNLVNNIYASVIGGSVNAALQPYSAVLAGSSNTVNGDYCTILGGFNNLAWGEKSVIVNGDSNETAATLSTIVNGTLNEVHGQYSAIINGDQNVVTGTNSVVLSGTNTVTGNYAVATGLQNTLHSDYSSITGGINSISINSEYSQIDGYLNSVTAPYGKASGRAAECRILGQESRAINSLSFSGYEQQSTIILDGYEINGGQFNLTVPITAANISMEDDKAYDIRLRVLVVSTTSAFECARYVYDILAHQESGTLVLDVVNEDLLDDNGTNWSLTISAVGSELVIQVDSYGTSDRRAMATIEWRELSRL